MNELVEIRRRLDRLDRENRRLRRITATAVVGLAAGILMGQASPRQVPGVVEAQKFVLQDARGESRAELTVLPDGSPTLGFLDREGKPRLVLGLAPDSSPGLALLDPGEKARLTLSLQGPGSSVVALLGPSRSPRRAGRDARR